MYEEIIKRLRSYNGWALNETLDEAADAIEDLQKLTDAQLDIIKQYQVYLTKQHWISVTERLPEDKKETYWCYTDLGAMCECRWTNNHLGMGESDLWGWNIIDVPQYQKVTHWMPLPAPPKEEET